MCCVEKNVRAVSARYQQVAADIAAKIVDRQYQVGEKIYTRSLIASQYSVSSETARRAIAILADQGIVETVKGSGVIICSYENARQFLNRFRNAETLLGMKRDALKRLDQLSREGDELRESLLRLVDYTDHFRNSNPFAPFEATVDPDSPCVGKSLDGLKFWQNTGATIVAVRRHGVLTVSPGPYAAMQAEDILYFVGEEDCVGRVLALLRGIPEA